jgi:hypothetical protein
MTLHVIYTRIQILYTYICKHYIHTYAKFICVHTHTKFVYVRIYVQTLYTIRIKFVYIVAMIHMHVVLMAHDRCDGNHLPLDVNLRRERRGRLGAPAASRTVRAADNDAHAVKHPNSLSLSLSEMKKEGSNDTRRRQKKMLLGL